MLDHAVILNSFQDPPGITLEDSETSNERILQRVKQLGLGPVIQQQALHKPQKIVAAIEEALAEKPDN